MVFKFVVLKYVERSGGGSCGGRGGDKKFLKASVIGRAVSELGMVFHTNESMH